MNYYKYSPIEYSVKDEYRRQDIKLLLPFFQMFDMANHLMCCEKILGDRIEIVALTEGAKGYEFEVVVDILVIAIEHNLEHIKQLAEEVLNNHWLRNNRALDFIKDVKLMTMKDLVSVCLPVKRNSIQELYTSTSCPLLWRGINLRIQAHLESLTCLEIRKNEWELFIHLVHCYLKN